MGDNNPVVQYDAHRDVYDSIGDRLDTTFDVFVSAERPLQKMMLQQAVTFALISAQTPVDIHEKGYIAVINSDSIETDHLAELLRDAGVNYCNNKARYINHNMTDADADRVIDHIENGEYPEALRALTEEFLGVAMAKGAYSLAKLGVPDMMCVDTHVGQMAGLEKDEVYSGVVPERYLEQCADIEAQYPELRDMVRSRFMFQWVLFDTNRGGITTHDAWFVSLPEESGVTIP